MTKRKRIQYKSDLPSMTQQHLQDECDVNSILAKYAKTGQISHVRNSSGTYADFSKMGTFKQNLDMVNEAMAEFMDLPAQLRAHFQNDPQQLIDFVSNDKNYDEAQKLGLIPASQIKEPKNDDKTTKTPAPTLETPKA